MQTTRSIQLTDILGLGFLTAPATDALGNSSEHADCVDLDRILRAGFEGPQVGLSRRRSPTATRPRRRTSTEPLVGLWPWPDARNLPQHAAGQRELLKMLEATR
jgi:hypothetical protein